MDRRRRDDLVTEDEFMTDSSSDNVGSSSNSTDLRPVYKAVRLCTTYVRNSGVRRTARRPPRIVDQSRGTACYKYVVCGQRKGLL